MFTVRDERNYVAYAADIGGDVFESGISKNGDHRIDGIFAGWGGGIRPQEAETRFIDKIKKSEIVCNETE